MNESAIRDYLANNLDFISKDLTLIDVEYYIPEAAGTRCYIDILAKSSNGKYIIIELKKSNATARQAMHEVLKYHASLKARLNLRDSEIECIVASTQWEELLLPFSSMLSKLPSKLHGMHIILVDGKIKEIASVTPLPLPTDRLISPIHTLRAYKNIRGMENGIESHIECFQRKNVSDYVLVILKAHPNFNRKARKTLKIQMEQMGFSYDDSMHTDLEYIIYEAISRKTQKEYELILQQDLDLLGYVKSEISANKSNEDDSAAQFEDAIICNLEPFPKSDYVEIGTPAKFAHKLLVDEEWSVVKIVRSGVFQKNVLLTDAKIIEEISGHLASNPGKLKKKISSTTGEILELKRDIDRCLRDDNPVWSQHIKFFIDQHSGNESLKIEVDILSPNSILSSLALQKRDQDGNIYLPHYLLKIENTEKNQTELYMGYLEWSGAAKTFHELLDEFFNGRDFEMAMPMTWGGYMDNDHEIMNALGLTYVSFKVEERTVSKFENFRFSPPIPKHHSGESIRSFYVANEPLIKQISRVFSLQ